jgi:5-hydroxyisourate hydrolase-like protein (transthyretin family)
MEPFTAKGFLNRYGSSLMVFHGADFTWTVMPSRLIEGIVKDAKTGRPLEGVAVESERFAGAIHLGVRDLKTQTDADGRFRLAGMPRAKGNMVRVVSRSDQPYFATVVEAPNPADLEPARNEISLQEGIWIEGKLTDQASGKPIPRARLYYFPYLSNSFAVSIPGFARDFLNANDRSPTTGDDGSFRLVGLPGRGIVGALAHHDDPYRLGAGSESIAGMDEKGHFPTFYGSGQPGKYWPTVMKEIDAPADAGAFHVDLEATAGASVRLRVVGPDGNPLAKVKSEGRTVRGGPDPGTLDAADAVVSKLGPDEERLVFFRQLDAKVGKAVRVRPGDDADGPVVVALEPLATITGRIVDEDGAAVPAASVSTYVFPLEDDPLHLAEVSSDADGRFVVTDVPIGAEYSVNVRGGPTVKSNPYARAEKVVVKPGETADVGELRFGGK